MRIAFLVVTALSLGAAGQATAQDTAKTKPGGLNKVAHNISSTAKKAGRDTKAELKRASSGAHRALKANGNEGKEKASAATGISNPVPEPVDAVARKVSHVSKKTGAHVKHSVKRTSRKAHHALTNAGKDAKEELKKP